jgi:quercetin dioxygenase-like cupin family protein
MYMKQVIIPAGQGNSYAWLQDHILVKTPHFLSDGRMTVVEDTLKPGFHLVRHHHKTMVEVFLILDGEVEFKFDDETVLATPGMTLNIPPDTWHEVLCSHGGRLITIFSPGGFDQYLAEMKTLTNDQFANESFMTALAEKYDTWTR